MKNEFSLERLAVADFASQAGQAGGVVPLAALERLAQESRPDITPDAPAVQVEYAVTASMRTDASGAQEPWIALHAATTLRMTCQRCLTDVELPVSFDRSFRFVASEELAEVEDEESEEDVLVLSKRFNLQELIEDELLMAMPLVPMHDVCPTAVRLQVADADFEDTGAEKPNPFAVLGSLKGKAG